MTGLHCPAHVIALMHFHCFPEPILPSTVNQKL